MEDKQHNSDCKRTQNSDADNLFSVEFFSLSRDDDSAQKNVETRIVQRFDQGKTSLKYRRTDFDVNDDEQGDEQRNQDGAHDFDFFYPEGNRNACRDRHNHPERGHAEYGLQGKFPARQHCRNRRKRGDYDARADSRSVRQGGQFARRHKQRGERRHKQGGEGDSERCGVAEKHGYLAPRGKSRADYGAYVKKSDFEDAPHTTAYYAGTHNMLRARHTRATTECFASFVGVRGKRFGEKFSRLICAFADSLTTVVRFCAQVISALCTARPTIDKMRVKYG